MFKKLSKQKDLALFIIRVGLGIMMIVHGYPKLMGGIDKWEKIGGAMSELGITFAPVFWGFMASFAEGVGGVLLILGWFFRPAAFLLIVTMLVAALKHLGMGDGVSGASHAIELGTVFIGLFILGPGKYSVDKS